MEIKSNVKAGGLSANHNETKVRDTNSLKPRQEEGTTLMGPHSLSTIQRLLIAAVVVQFSSQIAPAAVVSGLGGSQGAVASSAQAQMMLSRARAAMASATAKTDDNGNPNPGVHPPNSKPYGLSYGEWSAKWWQWVLQIPAATNPNLDATGADCAEGQSGQVWFLAESFGTLPSPIERSCTVPTGTSLLLPVLTAADGAGLLDCGGPAPFDVPCDDFQFNGKTGLAGLREEAKVSQDNPALLQLSLDGVALSDLQSYRAQSPVFSYTLMNDNVISFLLAAFGLPGPEPAGTYSPAVTDGYWVMFTPLSPGQHTIHFEGIQSGGFATGGVTYHLTVVPKGQFK